MRREGPASERPLPAPGNRRDPEFPAAIPVRSPASAPASGAAVRSRFRAWKGRPAPPGRRPGRLAASARNDLASPHAASCADEPGGIHCRDGAATEGTAMKGFARFAIGIGLVVMFTAASPAVAVAPPNNDGSDGSGNTAGGTNALGVLSTGFSNTAFGSQALAANTTASDNAAFGTSALTSATTGGFNTAVGASALFGNTTGTGNTAAGSFALEANVSGQSNTAVGESALRDNTGHLNTAVGSEALTNNTTGGTNAALGWAALMSNTTGANNAASGAAALAANTSGQGNTADGHNALASNDSGDFNAAVGDGALASNVAGKSNVAVGAGALASATGEGNVALGRNAGKRLVTGSNDVYVANPGASSESGVIRIGKKGVHTSAFLAGVSGVPVAGVPVVVTASGRLGVQASSERFKRDVETMGDRS